ncbi:hypothetical protein ALI22I_20835 [Saccharothrix sp. ALI-22-I]|uniref:class I SAM-dependent methyltransferase n=1 Tax=Saccharothrix sp. ALI-22-I TaxID=1933778 RepID=UPI00097BB4BC|nr:class I SAM-dependent methyltransferase [Saccharothrix sp. ALI-22-I]ONI87663.1 hypothetical protein ALI22I_20835 [Saccharothrix sp. ALI-22-I]
MDITEPALTGEATAYGVSAEFYDLLQGDRDRERARRRFTAAARRAVLGVLDVGAGTGIVTEVLVRFAAVPVHAVEPSRAMRTPLIARIARLHTAERGRVTVHPCTVQDCPLHRAVDLAVAANMIPCLPPDRRRATWHALADALVPGGLLLFDPPPEHPTRRREQWCLPSAHVGPDQYSAQVVSTPHEEVQRLRFTYRVHRAGQLIREEHEDFTVWPTSPALITRELREAGFTPVPAPHRTLRAALLRA